MLYNLTCFELLTDNLSSHRCPDMKTQPESAIHSPFTKRQPYQAASSTSSMLDVFLQDKGLPPSSSVTSSSSLPQQTTSSPHVVPPPASSLPKMAAVPSLGQQVSPSSSDAQGSSPLPLQQHKLRQQKKRTSITTKVVFRSQGNVLTWIILWKYTNLEYKVFLILMALLMFLRFQQWQWRCLALPTSQASIFSLEHCSLGQNQFYKSTSPPLPPQHQATRFRTVSTRAPAGLYIPNS